jgi:hypothetical protein
MKVQQQIKFDKAVGDQKVNERDWSCNQARKDISYLAGVRLQVVEPLFGQDPSDPSPNHQEAVCREDSFSFSEAPPRNVFVSRWRGVLGVSLGSATYRLQFLGPPTERGAPVLAETTVRAANIEGAITQAGDAEWPPGATTLRLVDLDGREVYERTKVDRSCVGWNKRS